MAKSYKPEVVTDSSGKWYGNALRFATREEAEASAQDLMSRWLLVRECRASESEDEPNYRIVDGRIERIKEGESNG